MERTGWVWRFCRRLSSCARPEIGAGCSRGCGRQEIPPCLNAWSSMLMFRCRVKTRWQKLWLPLCNLNDALAYTSRWIPA